MIGIVFHLTAVDNYPYNYSIQQGATLDWLTFVVEGDYKDWLPRGQIRDKYPNTGGTIKAEFSFDPLIFGEVTLPTGIKIMGTKIKPKINASTTTAFDWIQTKMQARKARTDTAVPGKNVWVYDIELVKDTEVIRLVQGNVEVSPNVTTP